MPLAALPFLAITVVIVARAWGEWSLQFSGPWGAAELWTYLPRVVVSAGMTLLGAALVIRHPRVHRSGPLLLVGAAVLALGSLVGAFSDPILSFLMGLSPGDDSPFLSAPLVAFSVALSVLTAFGYLYLARGLVRARRFEDRRGTRLLQAVILVLLLSHVVATVAQAGIFLGGTDLTTSELGLVGLSVLAALFELVVVLYFGLTATRGWLAGEGPAWGWALAAVAAWIAIATNILTSSGVFVATAVLSLDTSWFFPVLNVVGLASALALLLAFCVGLPQLDGIVWYDLQTLDDEAAAAGDPFADDDRHDGGPTVFELEERSPR